MMSLEDLGNLNVRLSKLESGKVVDVSNLTNEDVSCLQKVYNSGKYIIRGPVEDSKNSYALAFELNPKYGGQKNA